MRRIIFISFIILLFISCAENPNDPDEPLEAPSDLILTQLNIQSILLDWQDNSDDENGFRIDRKIGNNEWEENYRNLPANTVSIIDSQLTIFDTYFYRLCAYDADDFTDQIVETIDFRDIDSLNAPSNLVLTQVSPESISLSWQDNSSQEEGFRIERKIGDNDWEENYHILPPNIHYFYDENLDIIDNYTYRVSAFIGETYSEYIEDDIDFFFRDLYVIQPIFTGQLHFAYNEPISFVVELLDSNGEIVDRDYEVWFKYLVCPDGMNINNQVFGVGDSLSVLSNDGLVAVTLNAGSQAGTAAIEISAVNVQNNWINTIRSNIIVHSGIPENIELSHRGINSGQNMGAGVWQIEVAAIINDEYGNPYDYGTAVWFSLEDAQNSGIDPDWAVIGAAAYIGNENANGDSTAGVAYTYLNYEGSHTNDSLLVHCEVALSTGYFEETFSMNVPLQFGVIDIVATGDPIVWTPNTVEDSLTTNFTVLITDEQNNSINNQQIYFSGTHGHPVDMGTDEDNNAFTELTGVAPNSFGQVAKEWTFYIYECPPPAGNIPGTTTATITMFIPGADVQEDIHITLYRYP
ncbi:MAG: fibronectin type III domain-containing protein [Candidatus Cloacimonetes bacterium]|nr:fibronectin type III domain-containing protein [Candidatus Cloacimonadota bacterium]MCF7814866.1 fibronectin type III domain-containing protein [Candidatus Cloacimonadota bacterium]MCF7867948.1 fibronectin type III domain-containing protein [Candidatus Cloacimonadota bacterium]MCF7883406.1 fibronectin type III domain-containing protein [Candidatus Cloacimonadota bacterium]